MIVAMFNSDFGQYIFDGCVVFSIDMMKGYTAGHGVSWDLNATIDSVPLFK
jgi:hypothetical protein